MKWDQIFLLLGAALGGGGFLSAWISGRTTRKIEAAKTVAQDNQADLARSEAKLNRLQTASDNLINNLQAEITRKDHQIEIKDTRIAFLEDKIAEYEGVPARRASRNRKDTK